MLHDASSPLFVAQLPDGQIWQSCLWSFSFAMSATCKENGRDLRTSKQQELEVQLFNSARGKTCKTWMMLGIKPDFPISSINHFWHLSFFYWHSRTCRVPAGSGRFAPSGEISHFRQQAPAFRRGRRGQQSRRPVPGG